MSGIDADRFFKRIDQSQIAPFFLAKCKQLVLNCIHTHGKTYYAISGFRSPEEQEKLYNIGRNGDSRPTVTNAQGFKSYHNFGLAIDFCWDKDSKREGLQPGWEIESYKRLAEEAVKLGLVAGYNFKMQDGPHIQIPLNAIGLAKLETLYKEDGLEACWEEAEKVLTTNQAFKKHWTE